MKKILLPFLLIIVLVGCENTNEAPKCPVNADFEIVQRGFDAYPIYSKNDGLYAFFSKRSGNIITYTIKKSTDDGRTWTVVLELENNPDNPQNIFKHYIIDFLEADDGSYWVIDDGHNVSKSQDKGLTWANKNKLIYKYDLDVQKIIKDKDGIIYLIGEHRGLYRSIDYGESWEQLKNIYFDRFKIFNDNIFMYSVGESSLFISHDKGENWSKNDDFYTNIDNFVIKHQGNIGYIKNISYVRGENSVYYSIASKDSFLLLGSSSDNGITWDFEEIDYNNEEMYLKNLIGVNSSGEIFARFYYWNYYYSYCMYDEVLCKSSDNGKSWEKVLEMSVDRGSFIMHNNYVMFFDDDHNLQISKEKLY